MVFDSESEILIGLPNKDFQNYEVRFYVDSNKRSKSKHKFGSPNTDFENYEVQCYIYSRNDWNQNKNFGSWMMYVYGHTYILIDRGKRNIKMSI